MADRSGGRSRGGGRPAPGSKHVSARRSPSDGGRGRGAAKGAQSGRGRTDRRDRRRETPAEKAPPKYEAVHLGDEVVRELKSSARPGKGDILVKVFSDAVAAYAAGDLNDAIRWGDQAKHMALRSPNVREFLGLAYYDAGRWQEAARELAAFRRIAGTNQQNPLIADAYRAMGKPDKALEYADQVEPTSDPAVFFEARIVSAGALADMGRVEEGVQRLQTLDLEPAVAEEHHLRAWYVLADLLERLGKFTQARHYFESVEAADADLTDAPERAARLR